MAPPAPIIITVLNVNSAAELRVALAEYDLLALNIYSVSDFEFPAIMELLAQNAGRIKAMATRLVGWRVDFSAFTEMTTLEVLGGTGGAIYPPNVTHLTLAYKMTSPAMTATIAAIDSLIQVHVVDCPWDRARTFAPAFAAAIPKVGVVIAVADFDSHQAEIESLVEIRSQNLGFYCSRTKRYTGFERTSTGFTILRVKDNDVEDEFMDILMGIATRAHQLDTGRPNKRVHALEAEIGVIDQVVEIMQRIAETNRAEIKRVRELI